MDQETFSTVRPEQPGGSPVIALFLALYLLILAFFILLVSISSTEQVKAKAVMESLSSAFDSFLDPKTDLTPFTGNQNDTLGGRDFQTELTAIFSATLQVAKVEVIHPGRLLRVRIPVREVFEDGSPKVRPNLQPVLDRIVASMSNPPQGSLFETEVIMDGGDDRRGMLSAGRSLRTERAVAFVAEMMSRGMSPSSLGIGLAPSWHDEVVFHFMVRSLEDARLDFTGIRPLSAVAPPEPAEPAAAPPAVTEPAAPAADLPSVTVQ